MIQPSEQLIRMLKEYEGLRLKAYPDGNGIWTIGYGHTHGVRQGDVIDDAMAEGFLVDDMQWAMDCVMKRCPIHTANQFDAMVSLCYNIGCPRFQKSSVARNHVAGNYSAAAESFLLWNKPNLLQRRMKERVIYVTEDHFDAV